MVKVKLYFSAIIKFQAKMLLIYCELFLRCKLYLLIFKVTAPVIPSISKPVNAAGSGIGFATLITVTFGSILSPVEYT